MNESNDVIDRLRSCDPVAGRGLPQVSLDDVRERAAVPLHLEALAVRRRGPGLVLAAAAVVCVLIVAGLLLARRPSAPVASGPREVYAVFMNPYATEDEVRRVADELDRAEIAYRYVTKSEALAEFNRLYPDQQDLAGAITVDQMPTSFRLVVKGQPANAFSPVLTIIARLPGVDGIMALDGDVPAPPVLTTRAAEQSLPATSATTTGG